MKLVFKITNFQSQIEKKSTSPPKLAINVDLKKLPTFENYSKNA